MYVVHVHALQHATTHDELITQIITLTIASHRLHTRSPSCASCVHVGVRACARRGAKCMASPVYGRAARSGCHGKTAWHRLELCNGIGDKSRTHIALPPEPPAARADDLEALEALDIAEAHDEAGGGGGLRPNSAVKAKQTSEEDSEDTEEPIDPVEPMRAEPTEDPSALSQAGCLGSKAAKRGEPTGTTGTRLSRASATQRAARRRGDARAAGIGGPCFGGAPSDGELRELPRAELCVSLSFAKPRAAEHRDRERERGKEREHKMEKHACMDGWMDVCLSACLTVCLSLTANRATPRRNCEAFTTTRGLKRKRSRHSFDISPNPHPRRNIARCSTLHRCFFHQVTLHFVGLRQLFPQHV